MGSLQRLRMRFHILAYNVFGSLGSISKSLQPLAVPSAKIRFHVLPPSVVRYTPRSGLWLHSCPPAATYTTSGLVGCITTRLMVPVFSKPICVQVLPASVLLNIPMPGSDARKILASPVPAYKMLWLFCAIAMVPMLRVGCLSNKGCQLKPASVVFHRPLVANAAYITFLLPGMPHTSVARPLI